MQYILIEHLLYTRYIYPAVNKETKIVSPHGTPILMGRDNECNQLVKCTVCLIVKRGKGINKAEKGLASC